MPKEVGRLGFYVGPLTIKVQGNLYASSPAAGGAIQQALRRNMPSEAQFVAREAAGEVLRPIPELAAELRASGAVAIEEAQVQGEAIPTTVFRRDSEGKPFLHGNYLKGHLRENGDTLSRMLGFWGLQAFITKTLFVSPSKHYLEGSVQRSVTYFAPEVRLSTGVTVRQPTEKIAEFVVDPELKWVLVLVADARWTRQLLEDLLMYGSRRGLGPGRAIDESHYTFTLGELVKTDWRELPEF